jgi:16S rRNA (uracil1498-N3)-methyltransferase
MLPKDTAHYLSHVLRLKAGAALLLFDGVGRRGNATLLDSGAVEISSLEEAPPPPPPRVTLVCALSKGDKLDFIVEKATEAGAHAVFPVVSIRSVVQLKEERGAHKLQRWQRVAEAASRQSGRDHALTVHAPRELEELFAGGLPQGAWRWLDVGAGVLTQTLTGSEEDVVLATGPEGGWDPRETALAVHHGFVVAGLGPLTLRAETAPLVALSAVLARAGRL